MTKIGQRAGLLQSEWAQMLVKLSNTHYIKAANIDEIQIDMGHNRVKISCHCTGLITIEPEHGESLEAIADRIIGEINGSHYNFFEAQTR